MGRAYIRGGLIGGRAYIRGAYIWGGHSRGRAYYGDRALYRGGLILQGRAYMGGGLI